MATKRPRTKSRSAKRSRRSTAAADTYRGFSVQATRFLYHLLNSNADDVVSLEHFEDVGVETSDGRKVAEQDKSYTSRNPLSDRSTAFWRTFRNWVEAAQSGVLPTDKSRFIVYAPNVQPGAFVDMFHRAKTVEDAKIALQSVRSALWQEAEKRWDIADAAQEDVLVVFRADSELVAEVIRHLEVDAAKGTPEDSLKPLLLRKLVSEESYPHVIKWAHGWVKQRIDCLIEQRKPARVQQAEFHNALLFYVRSHDRLDILRSVAGTPTQSEVDAEIAIRDYVKQLRIIDADENDVLEAVNDFLCASIDRTTWSDYGMISEKGLETLENDLTATWRNKRRKIQIGYSTTGDKEKGLLVYCECLDHHTKVDGLETPAQFVRGSWHTLADERTVGWHPRYKDELDALRSKNPKQGE